MPSLAPRPAALAVALGAALAVGACGQKATYAPPDRVPMVRVHGTADPEITGVSIATSFLAGPTPGCQIIQASGLDPLPLDDGVGARADVVDGRFSVEAPLVWPEPSPCEWRLRGLGVSFERGGREEDSRTRWGPWVYLSGPDSTRKRPRLPTAPLPDTVHVACLLVGTVRPVSIPPVHCDFQPALDGGYEDTPMFQADPGTPPRDLDVVVNVRYVPRFTDNAGIHYDTLALKRAYGLD